MPSCARDWESLVAPACRVDEFRRRGARFVRLINETGGEGRAVLYRPDPDFEAQLRVGRYGKSILHMIANAFDDQIRPDGDVLKGESDRLAAREMSYPPRLLGMGLPRQQKHRPEEDEETAEKVSKQVPLDTDNAADRKDTLPVRRSWGGLVVEGIEAPDASGGTFEFQKVIYHPRIRRHIRERVGKAMA